MINVGGISCGTEKKVFIFWFMGEMFCKYVGSIRFITSVSSSIISLSTVCLDDLFITERVY